MIYSTYKDYLDSEDWKTKRTQTLIRDRFKCFICKRPADHVHHINYRNWMDVRPGDLISVCISCHKKIHESIDKGFIHLNNDGSISKTIKGLKKLTKPNRRSKNKKHARQCKKHPRQRWLDKQTNLSNEEKIIIQKSITENRDLTDDESCMLKEARLKRTDEHKFINYLKSKT